MAESHLASAASFCSVGDDPLKLTYKTLIDSFERYHTGADGHNLPEFASQLTKLKPEQDRKSQPSKEGKVPKASKVPASRGQQSLEAGGPPTMRVATKQCKHEEEEVAERGPVPPPFGGMPAAAASAEPDGGLPQEPDEPCSPEQYAEWMQYYRRCAEYFQQCEENCAVEAGLDRPASHSTSRPLQQNTRPAAEPEVPAAFAPYTAGCAGTSLPRTTRPSVAASGRHGAEPEPPAFGAGGSFPPDMSRLLEGLAGTSCSSSPPTMQQALQALQQQQQQQQLRQLQQLQQLQQLLQLQQLQQLTAPGIGLGGLGSFGGGLGGLGLGGLGLGGNLGGLGALGGSTPWPGLGLPGAPDLGAGSELSQESLANLLMAWYHSGYHTGLYASRQSK